MPDAWAQFLQAINGQMGKDEQQLAPKDSMGLSLT
jgi:hypothetical protein